jgi:hypothetical protein
MGLQTRTIEVSNEHDGSEHQPRQRHEAVAQQEQPAEHLRALDEVNE